MNEEKNVVVNVPRQVARSYGSGVMVESFVRNPIWISISEPGLDATIVHNELLQKGAHLKLAFWDIVNPYEHQGEILQPVTEEIAKTIVDFLLENSGNDLIVNCAAGVSRSGAICQFCEDHLKYHWNTYYKQYAMPNSRLYRLMIDYYYTNIIPQ